MSKIPLYAPPQGTYDLPFSWVYEAGSLADGSSFPNQYVELIGGYGDFVMRRIVGMNRILNPGTPNTGQYQIRDKSGTYIESEKTFSPFANDMYPGRELIYPELGAIKFDLFNILKPAGNPTAAQLAFMGSRRMTGPWVRRPSYNAVPKTFTYQLAGTIPAIAPYGPVVLRQQVNDYDFELFQIIILKTSGTTPIAATVIITEEPNWEGTATTPGAAGNLISFEATLAANQAIAATVVGNAIHFFPACDAGGVCLTTTAQAIAFLNAQGAVTALATFDGSGNVPAMGSDIEPPIFFTGGFGAGAGNGELVPLTSPVAKLWLFDWNRVACSNSPVLDIYYDGGPGGLYGNGSIVPSLYYPVNSQIEIDLYSAIDDPSLVPQGLVIYLVGRQWYPC